jgi:hypothetical protein
LHNKAFITLARLERLSLQLVACRLCADILFTRSMGYYVIQVRSLYSWML